MAKQEVQACTASLQEQPMVGGLITRGLLGLCFTQPPLIELVIDSG